MLFHFWFFTIDSFFEDIPTFLMRMKTLKLKKGEERVDRVENDLPDEQAFLNGKNLDVGEISVHLM